MSLSNSVIGLPPDDASATAPSTKPNEPAKPVLDATRFGHVVPYFSDASPAVVDYATRLLEAADSRSAESTECADACRDILQCCVSAYQGNISTATIDDVTRNLGESYVWNERFQKHFKEKLSSWYAGPLTSAMNAGEGIGGAWTQLDSLTTEFYSVCEALCPEVHAAYVQGRRATVVVGSSCIAKVWQSRRHASQFMDGCARIAQTLFEYQITHLHVPFSALLSVQGDYVTFTAAVPVTMYQPSPADGVGSVAIAAVRRLEAALCLPMRQRLQVHRGADGRYYIIDVMPAIVRGEAAAAPRQRAVGGAAATSTATTTTTATTSIDAVTPVAHDARPLAPQHLRQVLLNDAKLAMAHFAGKDTSAVGVQCTAYITTEIVNDVVQTLIDTLETTLVKAKLTKDKELEQTVSREALVKSGFVTKVLKRRGLPVRYLFLVVQQLDEKLRQCKARPDLAIAANVLAEEQRRAEAGMVRLAAPIRVPSPYKGTDVRRPTVSPPPTLSPLPASDQSASFSIAVSKPPKGIGDGMASSRRANDARTAATPAPQLANSGDTSGSKPTGSAASASPALGVSNELTTSQSSAPQRRSQNPAATASTKPAQLTPPPANRVTALRPHGKKASLLGGKAAPPKQQQQHAPETNDNAPTPETDDAFPRVPDAAMSSSLVVSQEKTATAPASGRTSQALNSSSVASSGDVEAAWPAMEASANFDASSAKGGEPTLGEIRRRVERVIEYYEPRKLYQVDQLMEKYRGNEKKLLVGLVKKYGPEPPNEATTLGVSQQGTQLAALAQSQRPPAATSNAATTTNNTLSSPSSFRRAPQQQDDLALSRSGVTAPPAIGGASPAPLRSPQLTTPPIAPSVQSVARINVEAVNIARQVVVAEMMERTLKCVLRAELHPADRPMVGPSTNDDPAAPLSSRRQASAADILTGRFPSSMAVARIELVNRLVRPLYINDATAIDGLMRATRYKFKTPAEFVLPPNVVAFGVWHAISAAPAAVGSVFDKESNRINRLKVLAMRHTAHRLPEILKGVASDPKKLAAASAKMTADWEMAADRSQLGKSSDLPMQQVLLRVAVISFLLGIKFGQSVADDLMSRVSAFSRFDPYAIIFVLPIAIQFHAFEGNAVVTRALIRQENVAWSRLCTEVDLPLRAMREALAGGLSTGVGAIPEGTALLVDSVDTFAATLQYNLAHVSASPMHFALLLQTGARCCLRRADDANRLLREATHVAQVLFPVQFSNERLSKVLLGVPTDGFEMSQIDALISLAQHSLEYHRERFGVDSTEARTALSVLLLLQLKKNPNELDPNLRADTLLALREQEAAERESASESDAETLGTSVASPSAGATTSVADTADSAVVGSVQITAVENEEDVDGGQNGSVGEQNTAPNGKNARRRRRKTTAAPGDEAAKKHVGFGDDVDAVVEFDTEAPILADADAVVPESEQQQQPNRRRPRQRLPANKAAVMANALKLTRLMLQQLAERELFYARFLASLTQFLESALHERIDILTEREREKRAILTRYEYDHECRVMFERLEWLARQCSLVWGEHGALIELSANRIAHRVWVYERDDFTRIHVREEYLHRKSMEALELQLRRTYALPHLEHLNCVALVQYEREQRRSILLEMRTVECIQWVKEEGHIRQRWIENVEQHQRRHIFELQEWEQRRHWAQRLEPYERNRIVNFMNFVGIESRLRQVEYTDYFARRRRWEAFQELHRSVFEQLEAQQRLIVARERLEWEERSARGVAVIEGLHGMRWLTYVDQISSATRHDISQREWLGEEVALMLEYQETIHRTLLLNQIQRDSEFLLEVQRTEWREAATTPAMRGTEVEETDVRGAITAESAALWTQIALDATHEIASTGVREIGSQGIRSIATLTSQLLLQLSATASSERGAFENLESIFRSTITSESQALGLALFNGFADGALRAIVRERTRWAVRIAAEQETRQRWLTRLEEHAANIVISQQTVAWIVPAAAFREQQLLFRALSRLIQLESWERVGLVLNEVESVQRIPVSALDDLERLRRASYEGEQVKSWAEMEGEIEPAQRFIRSHRELVAQEARLRAAICVNEHSEACTSPPSSGGNSGESASLVPDNVITNRPSWFVFMLAAERFARNRIVKAVNESVRATMQLYQDELNSFAQGVHGRIEHEEDLARRDIWLQYRWMKHFYSWEQTDRVTIEMYALVEREEMQRVSFEAQLLSEAARWYKILIWDVVLDKERVDACLDEQNDRVQLLMREEADFRAILKLQYVVHFESLSRHNIVAADDALRLTLATREAASVALASRTTEMRLFIQEDEGVRRVHINQACSRAVTSLFTNFVDAVHAEIVSAAFLSSHRAFSEFRMADEWQRSCQDPFPDWLMAYEALRRRTLALECSDRRRVMFLPHVNQLVGRIERVKRATERLELDERLEIEREECADMARTCLHGDCLEGFFFQHRVWLAELDAATRDSISQRRLASVPSPDFDPGLTLLPLEEQCARRRVFLEEHEAHRDAIVVEWAIPFSVIVHADEEQSRAPLMPIEARDRRMLHVMFAAQALASEHALYVSRLQRQIEFMTAVGELWEEYCATRQETMMACWGAIATDVLRVRDFDVVEPIIRGFPRTPLSAIGIPRVPVLFRCSWIELEETAARRIISLEVASELRRIHVTTFLDDEAWFRWLLERQRETWLANTLSRMWVRARAVASFQQLHEAEAINRWFSVCRQINEREAMLRRHCLVLEVRSRLIVVQVHELRERVRIQQTELLSDASFMFQELGCRGRIWSQRHRESTALWSDATLTPLFETAVHAELQLWAVTVAVDLAAADASFRDALFADFNRSLWPCVESSFMVAIVDPMLESLGDRERASRYAVYSMRSTIDDEPKARDAVEADEDIARARLHDRETSWRECVKEWDNVHARRGNLAAAAETRRISVAESSVLINRRRSTLAPVAADPASEQLSSSVLLDRRDGRAVSFRPADSSNFRRSVSELPAERETSLKNEPLRRRSSVSGLPQLNNTSTDKLSMSSSDPFRQSTLQAFALRTQRPSSSESSATNTTSASSALPMYATANAGVSSAPTRKRLPPLQPVSQRFEGVVAKDRQRPDDAVSHQRLVSGSTDDASLRDLSAAVRRQWVRAVSNPAQRQQSQQAARGSTSFGQTTGGNRESATGVNSPKPLQRLGRLSPPPGPGAANRR